MVEQAIMKLSKVNLLIHILLLYTAQQCTRGAADCPDDTWLASNGNCYKLYNEEQSWDDASNKCRQQGAHLLTLETAAEAAAIADYVGSTVAGSSEQTRNWFHIGIRRVESSRSYAPTYGLEGFTWVDGTPLSMQQTSYLHWDISAFDDMMFFPITASAPQVYLKDNKWRVDFSGTPQLSLDARERFICKINKNMFCAEKVGNPSVHFKDSRMTSLLCSVACISDGYTGYAVVDQEECMCNNDEMPSSVSAVACDVSCRQEYWLSCGSSDSKPLYRALTFYGENATTSLAAINCTVLYNNGVIRSLTINGEECALKSEPMVNASKNIYCHKTSFFPLRTMCVYIHDFNTIPSYSSAQFDVCGQQAHSDLIVFNRPHRKATAGKFSKTTAKQYGESTETDAIAVSFTKLVAPSIPFLKDTDWRYILSGAVTYKMSNHPRTSHGSLSAYWPAPMNDRWEFRPNTLVLTLPQKTDFNLAVERTTSFSMARDKLFKTSFDSNNVVVMCADIPGYMGCYNTDMVSSILTNSGKSFTLVFEDKRFLNIYGCIELCRGTSVVSSYAYITNSICYCTDQLVGSPVTTRANLCFSPCPDPTTIQQCPSVAHRARAFNLDSFPLMASSCAELWRNGAYHFGPYRIKYTENGTTHSLQVYCHEEVPLMVVTTGMPPLDTIDKTGFYCVPHYGMRSGVIDGWHFEGNYTRTISNTKQKRPDLFSKNNLRMAGMGCYFRGPEPDLTIFLPHLYLLRGLKVLGRGDLDIEPGQHEGTKGHIKQFSLMGFGLNLDWTVIGSRLEGAIEHAEDLAVVALSRPTIVSRLKFLIHTYADPPVMRVELLGDTVGTPHHLRNFEEQQTARESSLGCYLLDSSVDMMSLTLATKKEAMSHCAAESYPYLAMQTGADGDSASSIMHCVAGGKIQVAKVDDSHCSSERNDSFYELFDVFDITKQRCEYPPDAPGGYEWTGVNLINQHMQLLCKQPKNAVDKSVIEKFKCLDTLQWDRDINNVRRSTCARLPCADIPPEIPMATAVLNGTSFPGDMIHYTCDIGYQWKHGVSQKAMCENRLSWKLVESTYCTILECPQYISGYANISNNLHPIYELSDPDGYAEFSQMRWMAGSSKRVECPFGSSFSNARHSGSAICSKETGQWHIPFGKCIRGNYEPAKSPLLTAEVKDWKRFIPVIVLLTLIMVGTITAYAVYTVYHMQKGKEFKADSQASVLTKSKIEANTETGFVFGSQAPQSHIGSNAPTTSTVEPIPKTETAIKTEPARKAKSTPKSKSQPKSMNQRELHQDSVSSVKSHGIPPIVVDDYDRSGRGPRPTRGSHATHYDSVEDVAVDDKESKYKDAHATLSGIPPEEQASKQSSSEKPLAKSFDQQEAATDDLVQQSEKVAVEGEIEHQLNDISPTSYTPEDAESNKPDASKDSKTANEEAKTDVSASAAGSAPKNNSIIKPKQTTMAAKEPQEQEPEEELPILTSGWSVPK